MQGVGFRATTRSIAMNFDVTGWVRNEPDGSVRCVAEGPPDELDRFVTAVREHMASCIDAEHLTRGAATGAFADFRIEY